MRTLIKVILAVMSVSACIGIKAQTVNPLWVDGRVYFKVSDNTILSVSDENGRINPKDVYFLDGLVEKYQISEVVMPFLESKSDNVRRIFRVDFEDGDNIEQFIKELEQSAAIQYAEPAPMCYISAVPNDTYYNKTATYSSNSINTTWHLDLINAEEAWELNTGNPEIVVAVLDNAIWTKF